MSSCIVDRFTGASPAEAGTGSVVSSCISTLPRGEPGGGRNWIRKCLAA